MWKTTRLCLLCLCAGILALAGCSRSETADAAKAKAEAEAAKAEVANLKSELAQVKSELTQVKSDLAKHRAPQETSRVEAGRYQLIMNSKGEPAYLFDTASGQVRKQDLGNDIWGDVVLTPLK
jgi:hypothetical protein